MLGEQLQGVVTFSPVEPHLERPNRLKRDTVKVAGFLAIGGPGAKGWLISGDNRKTLNWSSASHFQTKDAGQKSPSSMRLAAECSKCPSVLDKGSR